MSPILHASGLLSQHILFSPKCPMLSQDMPGFCEWLVSNTVLIPGNPRMFLSISHSIYRGSTYIAILFRDILGQLSPMYVFFLSQDVSHFLYTTAESQSDVSLLFWDILGYPEMSAILHTTAECHIYMCMRSFFPRTFPSV